MIISSHLTEQLAGDAVCDHFRYDILKQCLSTLNINALRKRNIHEDMLLEKKPGVFVVMQMAESKCMSVHVFLNCNKMAQFHIYSNCMSSPVD